MQIDRISAENFKLFESLELDLHSQFNLLVGDNGCGKTSVLDALAVALGIWLESPPDAKLASSKRPIYRSELRQVLVSSVHERKRFTPVEPGASVTASGRLLNREIAWSRHRKVNEASTRRSKSSRDAHETIKSAYARVRDGDSVVLPVIAYYGAGRAWMPHRTRQVDKTGSRGRRSRWDAFYDCLNERIRTADISHWFAGEAIYKGHAGTFRPGYYAVRHAVLQAIPNAGDLWVDPDFEDIAIEISGNAQPFENLSSGQRTIVAMVADLAIRMVEQNPFLCSDRDDESTDVFRVLAETPGVVLIDELDVHLHPRWQRRIAHDLMSVFPKVQFVTTSHSPLAIGALPPEMTRDFDAVGRILPMPQSIGLDANTLLEERMHTPSQADESRSLIDAADVAIESGELDRARRIVADLRTYQRGISPDTAELQAAIDALEAMADAED